jgi:hypothetical protein
MSERFVPAVPPLYEGRFRERRTSRQRRRSFIRTLDVNRQRALVAAARLARPITRKLRNRG